MSEMVERVARAILQAEADERGIEAGWDGLPPNIQHALVLQARAAIEAMREPTEGMLSAAAAKLYDASQHGEPLNAFVAGHYRAMIDGALG